MAIKNNRPPMASPFFALEMLSFTIIVVCIITLGVLLISRTNNWVLFLSIAGVMTLALIILMVLVNDPDAIRARQTDAMLKLARQTLAALKDGLNGASAERICVLLLPSTGACGIIVTSGDKVLGRAGFNAGSGAATEDALAPTAEKPAQEDMSKLLANLGAFMNEPEAAPAPVESKLDILDGLAVQDMPEEPSPTKEPQPMDGYEFALAAAAPTMQSGIARVLVSPRDVDFSAAPQKVGAAIVVPLTVGSGTQATLQLYYANARKITNTQMSIADGFGQLLSTQLAASQLEEQTKLATTMQLKALQNQINPHFLFNTLNTIAALIRTEPMRARSLLREFATFYRTSLKDPDEHGLILLSKEIEQTVRYFTFEEARFGADRVELQLGESEDVEDIPVPAFIIQPLVENAVRHAMPAEGKLTIRIEAELEDFAVNGKTRTALVIRVTDDGRGMTEDAVANIMHPEYSAGAGIAVKNVADRIKGYFGQDSAMKVESELGTGTTVSLILFLGEN